MRRVLVIVAAAVFALSTVFAGPALADTTRSAFQLHIADAFLQQAAGSPPFAIAMADNGDTVSIQGSGAIDASTGSANASGVFIHHMVATGQDVHGTWTASRLISFQFYGCGSDGVPSNFCGGLAKLDATLTPDAQPSVHLPSTLWVDCLIGTKVPAGRAEGVRLNVRDVINFNHTEESGFTLFVMQ